MSLLACFIQNLRFILKMCVSHSMQTVPTTDIGSHNIPMQFVSSFRKYGAQLVLGE